MQVFRLVQQELNVAYETSIFGQCSCCINIDENSHPEEKELGTNPSLTLAQTLALSTSEHSLWQFYFQ